MNNMICCGKEVEPVVNTEWLLNARNKGIPEDEAQDFALRGHLCPKCLTWCEVNDSGKIFVIHLPTGKEV